MRTLRAQLEPAPLVRSRRTAALLHSDSVSIYLGAARLLERILARAPLGDP